MPIRLSITIAAAASLAACTESPSPRETAEVVAEEIAAEWTAQIRAGSGRTTQRIARAVRREGRAERASAVEDRVQLRIEGVWFCVGEYTEPDRGIATRRGRCG